MPVLPRGGRLSISYIFHIAQATDWEVAQQVGAYRRSTIGKTLDEVGFIHCSYRGQVEAVANAVYRGTTGLLVLIIDPGKANCEIRAENLEGGSELFPHIYGPLNLDAVVQVLPLAADADGRFRFSGGLS